VTDLVSLLLIALILIDCKITNFSLHLTIIIFGELTSATSEERITMNIIFVGTTPIN